MSPARGVGWLVTPYSGNNMLEVKFQGEAVEINCDRRVIWDG
jgi:hypothetical protein